MKFTDEFILPMLTMSNLGRDCRHEEAKALYRTFVETFGTHYITNAQYGASLVFQKVYRNVSSSSSASQARKECAKTSFEASLSVEADSPFVNVDIKSRYNENSKSCEEGSSSGGSGSGTTSEDVSMTSKGSR